MNQDQAATTLDPGLILDAAASDTLGTQAGEGTGPVDTYLDLEERIVFDLTERVVPGGDDLVAEARARHRAILSSLAGGSSGAETRRLVAAHVHEARTTVYPQLLDHLDPPGREDLAAALEEARLSRQEADVDLPPTEATTPAADDAAPSPEPLTSPAAPGHEVEHETGTDQARTNREEEPPA